MAPQPSRLPSPDTLSEPSRLVDNGVHDGYRQAIVITGGVTRRHDWDDLIAPLAPIRECWISWLEPGGYILEHHDAGPYWERWQIPLTEAGQLIQDGEPVAHEVGVPFQVYQDRWHSVRNASDTSRVSLVIDRDIPSGAPSAPFRVKE
jgi:hypothetical protein